jgi:tetratricopeptide (TPR) repeat protein
LAASSDLFLKAALVFFGDPATAESAQGGFDKGKRLAQLVAEKRALLILDGLEPLQYAPTSPTPGELKDEGLKALLKALAQGSRGLCVVTTRYSIPDLQAFRQGAAPEKKLLRLSKEAGVALLRSLGVKGTQAEYEKLVEDVKGHALTLNLLGSFLRDAHGGDIRKRDRVKLEEADAKNEHGGHAFRVMDAYVKWIAPSGLGAWLRALLSKEEAEFRKEGRRAFALLRLLGLFDRPADAGCLDALWKAPAIAGLTEPLIAIAEAQRNIVLKRLEDAGLLTVNRDTSHALVSLDAHPLLREYFARELCKNPAAWEAAHKRLLEHLCETKDKEKPTLDDLQPLYQAVAHGCQAGLQKEACEKVYHDRTLRGTGSDGFYSTKKLGAYGSDLGAVACFFDAPWSRVADRLAPAYQALLLAIAAFNLRALGRLTEALEPMRAVLERDLAQVDWKNAAVSASSLSELELTLGDVAGAVEDAEICVTHAERSGDANWRVIARTTLADTLHQAGRPDAAAARFAEAEAMQAERQQPAYPLLYSLQGFRYCDLLLGPAERAAWRRVVASLPTESLRAERSNPGAAGDSWIASPSARNDGPESPEALIDSCRAVSERAAQTLQWAEQNNAALLDFALNYLTLGRSALYAVVLAGTQPGEPCRQSLRDAVDGLRRAGQQQELPRGLLTCAWLRRLDGDLAGAREDLDEAFEIAERGPMPLHLADIHLYRARLFGAGADRPAAYPWDSATADLAEARRLIFKHGYLRRKEELEDAEAALRAITGDA